jgi:hypothetical protein
VPGDPDEVNRQAAHLASVARQITSQVAALRAIAADADGSLTGAYATKIHAAAGDTGGQLAQVAGRYEKASTALRAWAPDLEYTQALSLRALNQAEAPYLTLKNLVPPQSAGGPLTAAQEQDQQAYKRVAGRAQFALDAARALLARAVSVRDEAAARCAAAIRAASDDAIADYWVFGGAAPISRQAGTLLEQAAAGSTRALAALLAIQRGGRPGLAQAVAAWWQLLTTARQHQLLTADPGVLGWLDGLPANVRDAANRTVFWSTYAKLEAEKAKLEAEVKGDTSGVLAVPGLGSLINDADGAAVKQAELAHIEGILQGMDAIKAVLGPPGQGNGALPPVYLLGFDANNLGHAIVSIGDPDTANNVVTYVPGLGSGFPSTASGDLARTTRLWRQASAIAPAGATVASVYWLGYDAPQLDLKLSESSVSPVNLAEDAQVALAADAQGAAPALDSFAAGLAAAHHPSFPAHTVMLGHSYGSLVVGEAAVRAPGKLADDLAFVGSPGVGVNKATQLGVPAAHVFAGAAANDPVPDLPPADPVDWFSGSAHFGTNPAFPQFGARDFYVNPGKPVSLTDPIGAHSQYWDLRSASLGNLANIVDGQYGQVRWAPS